MGLGVMVREPGFYWVRAEPRSEPEIARWHVDERYSANNRWYWPTFYDAEDVPYEVLSERLMPPLPPRR